MSALRWLRQTELWQALLALLLAWDAQLGLSGVGLPALLLLIVLWPPAVSWRPLPLPAVLRSYFCWLPAFALLLVVYLRGLHACGIRVPPQPLLQELATDGLAAPSAQAGMVLAVLLAPLVEELLFRGYLYTALRRVLPALPCLLGTALLFGLAHGVVYALPVAVLGFGFGWLRERHGSLLPAIAAHALHNGLTVVLVLLFPSHLAWLYPQ